MYNEKYSIDVGGLGEVPHSPLLGNEMSQHRKLLEVGAHCIPYITDLLINLHKLFPKAKIVGHRDLPGTSPKECPCFDAHALFGWIARGRRNHLVDRMDDGEDDEASSA